MVDDALMSANTACVMSLWRSPKPVICKIRGYAVAGGSDIALCCGLKQAVKERDSGEPT